VRRTRVISTLVIAAGAALAGWLVHIDDALDRPLDLPPGGITYVVERGDNLRGVADAFAREGWLDAPRYLTWAGRWSGDARHIKAGEFFVPTGTSARGLLELLVRGRVVQHAFTLVEGWTFAQAVAALRSDPRLQPTPALEQIPLSLAELGLGEVHPEGSLLPDTYFFTRGTTDVQIVRRAHHAMQRYLSEQWDARAEDLPYATPYEALILASIIEKETGLASERPHIAGVFVRRLRLGMRLQTDPTVIYGLGTSFDGDLKRHHLREPGPYNTYVIAGLTPTPIAMPGRDAIRAALHPAEGDALFFVSRGDGSHHFSATYAEHSRAVDDFQRGHRKAGRAD
jgi:UPF0755 protein